MSYSISNKTKHVVYLADSKRMAEVLSDSIQLIVTSPPYYNAPHDYKDVFSNYEEFLSLMKSLASEAFRTLQDGRIACINCDDMLVNGEKFPIVSDVIRIFKGQGFKYRDQIIWRKPDGYIRASRRSGVLIQHPYPMYFYPDNVRESIIVFQKGRIFNYQGVNQGINDLSKVDVNEYLTEKWYLNEWHMTNVLPLNRIEKGIAAFPDELPYRLIKLYSYVGDTVLDPFLGSGTTSKVARLLGRNSIGYEINTALISVIEKKVASELKGKRKLLEPESPTTAQYELEIKTRGKEVIVAE
jgi:modification methylase